MIRLGPLPLAPAAAVLPAIFAAAVLLLCAAYGFYWMCHLLIERRRRRLGLARKYLIYDAAGGWSRKWAKYTERRSKGQGRKGGNETGNGKQKEQVTNALHFVEEVLLRPLLAYRFPLSGCPSATAPFR